MHPGQAVQRITERPTFAEIWTRYCSCCWRNGVAYNLPVRMALGDFGKRFFDPIFAEILTRIGLTPPPEHMDMVEALKAQPFEDDDT
jgi:hypothetical protein